MRNTVAFVLLVGLCCFAQAPERAHNPTRVQISSTTVNTPTLTCSGPARQATVTVQVWIIGGPPQRPKGQYLTIGLYEASSAPPGNRIRQDEETKQVEVGESPAILEYKLECRYDSKPGDISFTASITKAPDDFEVVPPDPPENGKATIHVK